ncbi:MAG: TIGR03086 family metal-binding protein [Acidimicrobiales bacterium]|jgi:uncharacterized protein (TIGR03086 family)
MSSNLSDLDVLQQSLAYFGEILALVVDEDWERPVVGALPGQFSGVITADEIVLPDGETVTPGWDVRQLVSHVVVNEAQMAALINGEPVEWTTEIEVSVLGRNAMATWRGAALATISGLSNPGALSQIFEHPVGSAAGQQLLGLRVIENLAHGWDLAITIEAERPIPEDLATWALAFLLPIAGAVLDSDHFGTAVEVEEGAPAAHKLLALLGRPS